MTIGRRVISLAVATTLALALPGCNEDEKKAEAGTASAGEPTKKTGDTPPGDDGGKAEGGAVNEDPPEVPPDPSGFTEAGVSYPAALDQLLDLVPADEQTFIVVRDPGEVLSLFGMYVADQVKGLLPLAKTAEPAVAAQLEQSALIYAKLGVELAKGVINLDKGMVLLPKQSALIYGANDPNALPNLMRELGATELPDQCVALDAAPGYAVCGDDESKLKALAPGKKAASMRPSLVAALPGFDVERGNFVGQIADDTPAPIAFAIATPPGSVRMVVGLGPLLGEQAEFLGTGKPTAMGLADPGAAFVWAKIDTDALEPMLEGMGPPASTVGGTFQGEVFAGGIHGGVPLAVMFGVTDPYPAAGMISLASAMLDQVPKELPDGTKVQVEVAKVQAGGKEVQYLHGKLSGSKSVESLAELGVTTEGFAFVAGKFAAAAIGTNADVVKTIAEFEGAGPSQALLARLPPALAKTLTEGGASWALHVPLDGLQAPQMKEQMAQSIGLIPESDRGGLPPDAFANAMLSVIAPLSSVSMWLTHPDKERVLNVSVEAFADDETDKGKAAREAVAKVTAGADRKATYDALASSFDDPRFKARTGTDDVGLRSALSGAFMLGMVAAVAMPVFLMRDSAPPPMPPPAPMPVPIDPPAPPPVEPTREH